ncbi:DUF1517 domain-containing protein [Oscillatoria sp. CS-180]|uniref:DUF1517 domain-containing protein n=1 Tax=Oscillatoria sp. CS-180 TaxID=3021720 RepID=UPI00232C0376|nr:DUF1517 domain-containing protein [Oscillatoria sp. CS-180]MDB9524710.1 DUF1517 domain-containing protein [Oscillatoria sp. CS-180]
MGHKLQNFFGRLKPLIKPFMALALVGVLMLGHADSALAARGGGRIGGGSFRAPSRTISPTRSYRGPSGGGYYPGGGFGFPFLFPLFGFGGGFGGLFTVILFIGLANFIMRAVRESGGMGSGVGGSVDNPTVSVAKLQIGLLAEARYLQDDLNRMALSADTSSSEGLTQVLQEATLSLLRHPEYWQYATAATDATRLLSAEQSFNQMVLAERSKLTGETLTNVNNRLQQADSSTKAAGGELTKTEPGEYIVASVIVATQGKLSLPKVSSTQDVRKALSTLGAVSSDRLLAVEILWTPQASGETLTSDEVIAEYPELTLI